MTNQFLKPLIRVELIKKEKGEGGGEIGLGLRQDYDSQGKGVGPLRPTLPCPKGRGAQSQHGT